MDAEIVLTGDKRVRCPVEGCKVSMVLTQQGADLMMARQTKCREHGQPLIVEDR